jgi:AAHS family 3-hydroxyphenylpropionic acid transporter
MSNDTEDGAAARRTILFCVLAAVCEGIDLQAAGVAAVGIGAEFQPAPDQLANYLSASTLGLFFGALIGGRLADSLGRKGVLIASIALFGLFSLLTPLAWDLPSLTYARLLTGLGLGGALPNLIALVAESSAPNRRNLNVALMYSGNPIGGAIVSLVLLLIATSQWRRIFLVGGILPLILAPLMAFGVRESAAFRHAAAQAAELPKRGSFLSIMREGRAVPTLLLWASFFLGLLTLYLFLSWLPTLLIGNGLSRGQAAVAQIGFNVGGAVAALVIGLLLEGRVRSLSLVTTFVALPLLLIALARAPAQVATILILVCLMGCAVIAAQAFLYAAAPSVYPTSIRGVGVGATVAVGRIGSIAGPKLGGMLKSAGHDYAHLMMDLLPIVIVGSVCALILAWYTSRRPSAG